MHLIQSYLYMMMWTQQLKIPPRVWWPPGAQVSIIQP